jgi:FAD/FMN-containing dehydrogenase
MTRLARLRVGQGLELGGDLVDEVVLVRAGRDDALSFAAGLVDVEAVEPDPVGPGPGPVRVVEQGRLLLVPGPLEPVVAVVEEPGVEVEAAPEGVEAVVRHDKDDGVLVRFLEGQVEGPVHLTVGLGDDVPEAGGELGVVGRVPGVGQPPEHVLALVGAREVVKKQPGVETARARTRTSARALFVDHLIEFEEFLLIEEIVVEGCWYRRAGPW